MPLVSGNTARARRLTARECELVYTSRLTDMSASQMISVAWRGEGGSAVLAPFPSAFWI